MKQAKHARAQGEARPNPLWFLTKEQTASYGDLIEEALDAWPPGSWDRAAMRLLASHYTRGKVPGHSARQRTAKWIRDGARHEMIIAGLVIASEQTDLGNPFLYVEKGLLPTWKGEVKVKPVRLRQAQPDQQSPGRQRSRLDNLDDL